MRSRILLIGIALVGLLSIQASCKTGKVGGNSDCPKKSVEELSAILKNTIQTKFEHYYAKVKVDIKSSTESNSFNASVKMRTDSAFTGTVKVAGIIGAAYIMDVDSFAYKNKLKKCFKVESYSSLSETFGTEVNYQFVQQLVLGQAVGVESLTELYPLKDDQFYVLASHDKKAFQRLEAYNLNDEEQNDIFIKYILDCESLELVGMRINVPKDQVDIIIDFTKRQKVQGIVLPEQTKVKIVTAEDSVFIDLEYTKTELNEIRRINFSVPGSYSECE